jgi:chaperone required for assembly of F1-ATPase
MTGWAPKRFWTEVTLGEVEGSHAVLLDGKPIRTPAKALLTLPTLPLAQAVAEEWARQEDVLRPATMPMTRLANTALDRVVPEFAAVARIVAAYAETDLLCYRAEAPDELRRLQDEAWDPLLDWAEDRFGARLLPTSGVVPIAQPPEALDRLATEVASRSAWHLTPLHELVSLTGSLVLGLAVADEVRLPEEGWALSRIDEEWQNAQWGRDAEADAAAARRQGEYLEAVRFYRLLAATGSPPKP